MNIKFETWNSPPLRAMTTVLRRMNLYLLSGIAPPYGESDEFAVQTTITRELDGCNLSKTNHLAAFRQWKTRIYSGRALSMLKEHR